MNVVKVREIPIEILQHEALLRRLPNHHRKRSDIEKNLAWRKAGYYGEESLDYHLSYVRDKSLFILHNLRLKLNQHYFQIDSLILSPNFALILEVKNIAGILRFDPFYDQLIRTYNQKAERLPNPIHQANRQRNQFIHWLRSHFNLPALPIEFFIVNTNTSTIIEATPETNRIFEKIVHLENVTEKIKSVQKYYTTPVLDVKTLKSISRQLVKQHTPLIPNILKNYQVQISELMKGVPCSSCLRFSMIRVHGNWSCPRCGRLDRVAHEAAIRDYFLLIGTTITNAQCREFLGVSSRTVARKLMQSMNLRTSGLQKYVVYNRPW